MQDGLLEITFLAATMEFEIRTVHIESKMNLLADKLSRWDLDLRHREEFFEATKKYKLQEFEIGDELFAFSNNW